MAWTLDVGRNGRGLAARMAARLKAALGPWAGAARRALDGGGEDQVVLWLPREMVVAERPYRPAEERRPD